MIKTDNQVSETPSSLKPMTLEGDLLQQRAWRMPDLIIYQHGPDEWWVAPLDEGLPLIRLNRRGASLLSAMDGFETHEGIVVRVMQRLEMT